MGTRYYCTYFDKNYLVRGISMIASLNRHEKDFRIFVVCLDELTRLILNKLDMANVLLVPLHEIEERDLPLAEARKNRSAVEYYWTLTPSILLHLLKKHSLEQLTYLDSDLYFYSSPAPIFEEFGTQSILIHEHRFSEAKRYLEIHGIYNVGLLIFRNDPDGLAALDWWRQRCNEWCYARVEGDRFGDQLYLNQFPILFDKVHVLANICAGVAPWNHEQYRIESRREDNTVLINGQSLIFYHFHALEIIQPNIIIPIKYPGYDITWQLITTCYLPYFYSLNESIARIWSVVDDYAFGLYSTEINEQHPFVAISDLHSTIRDGILARANCLRIDDNWLFYYN